MLNDEKDPNKYILSYDEFMLLHSITLSWPDGVVVSVLEPSVDSLRTLGFIKQSGNKWLPTEAGVSHIIPEKLRVA